MAQTVEYCMITSVVVFSASVLVNTIQDRVTDLSATLLPVASTLSVTEPTAEKMPSYRLAAKLDGTLSYPGTKLR